MSSLADIARVRGYHVAGYDRDSTAIIDRLISNGIKVNKTYNAENVEGFDLVVYSAAISDNDPELLRAKELNIPCIKRSKFLGTIMFDYKNRIGVAGMHGKSTVTSIISNIYLQAELDPTIVNGSEMTEINGAYKLGNYDNFIFEACEYTDSFLDFHPTTAVILNVEMDHPDYFKDMNHIYDSFTKYINIADKAVINADDANIKHIIKDYAKPVITFGVNDNADYKAVNITHEHGFAKFDVIYNNELLCSISLSIPGSHNIYNALAGIAAAHQNGVDISGIVKGVETYKGAKRRFEFKHKYKGAYIYEDYAHHPTAIVPNLESVKNMAFNKVWCVYQPHMYSRTAELYDDFLTAFDALDETDTLILVDIYAARESNIYGVTSEQLSNSIAKTNGKDNTIYISSFAETAEYLKKNISDGDIVLLMGAGDVNKIGDLI
jgi:UDP-N-acetylmuramate--alanine ligase